VPTFVVRAPTSNLDAASKEVEAGTPLSHRRPCLRRRPRGVHAPPGAAISGFSSRT